MSILDTLNFLTPKKITVNHRTGRRTGRNENVLFETKTSRKGVDESDNTTLDIIEGISRLFTKNSIHITSAYIEEVDWDYIVAVTFSDGSSETKSFALSFQAERFLKELKKMRPKLHMLRGSIFTNTTVLINKEDILNIQKIDNILKIKFKNDSQLSIKYDTGWDCRMEFENLGESFTSTRGAFSFGNSSSRLDDILNGRR